VRNLAILLDPFVPSAAEKLWKMLNFDDSVHEQSWQTASEFRIKGGYKIGRPEILFRIIEKKK